VATRQKLASTAIVVKKVAEQIVAAKRINGTGFRSICFLLPAGAKAFPSHDWSRALGGTAQNACAVIHIPLPSIYLLTASSQVRRRFLSHPAFIRVEAGRQLTEFLRLTRTGVLASLPCPSSGVYAGFRTSTQKEAFSWRW
jgi:hypothetical protein